MECGWGECRIPECEEGCVLGLGIVAEQLAECCYRAAGVGGSGEYDVNAFVCAVRLAALEAEDGVIVGA